MLKDKNIEVCLQAFADIQACWYCATLPTARGEDSERLVSALNSSAELNANSKVDAFGSVDMAYKNALINAQSDDIILVMGSFLTVAAVLKYHASA
jgi:dihydrofolate synthase/folylpolyglutamate synthase